MSVRSRLVLFVAVSGVAFLTACASAPPSDSPPPARSIARVQRQYADAARRSWDGAGPRPLSTLIWFPASPGAAEEEWVLGPPDAPLFRLGRSAPNARPAQEGTKRPLVVLSHGTGGSAAMLAWLAEPLARDGYIVAAVNHHGNTAAEREPAAAGFMLWWERATDVSRVVDALLADPELGALIDPARIGAAGFSLGGYTVLALAGATTSLERWESFCRGADRDATCVAPPEFPDLFDSFAAVDNEPVVAASLRRHGDSFRDPRIRAVFAIAPLATPLTDESLAAIRIPLHVVVGSADRTTPAKTNAARVSPHATRNLSVIEDAGHYTFLAECTPAGKAARPDLCSDGPEVDRATVHQAVAAQAVSFFNRALGTRVVR